MAGNAMVNGVNLAVHFDNDMLRRMAKVTLMPTVALGTDG